MRDLQSRDPEDPSWGGKAAGDTLLLGIPSNKRLALLVTAVALVCLLFFMPGRSGDDGDLAERRAGGSERLDHSPLLSDGFDRTAVAPLPHATGTTGKGSYGGVKAADASSSLHRLPSSAASSSLHRTSSAPSAPGRAPSPKAAPSPVAKKNSLGTDASKKGTLLNSVHSIADSKKKLMPPAEQDDDEDDDEESPMDENEDEDEDEDGDEEGRGVDEDDEDDEGDDDDDDDEIVEHEDEDDRRSEEEMTEYANVMFDKMDKNENGRVSWKEYHKVIKNDADFEDETTAEQREDFDEIDTNKDGYISRDEMVRTNSPPNTYSVHRPRGAPWRVHPCVWARVYSYVCVLSRSACSKRSECLAIRVCVLLLRARAPHFIFSLFLRHSLSRLLALAQIRDWLRDDLDYGDGEEDDDEDDEDDDDAGEDEGDGDEDGGDEEGDGKVRASKGSTMPTSAKTKATVGAKTTTAGSGVGGAGKATSQPSAGKGKTLGESIKDVALKVGSPSSACWGHLLSHHT
jgi:hypothetical protein